MAGLAAATCDASFRCNGWVAVSPGVSPAGAPASTYAAQTTSVSGSRSGGSLFALCVRPTGPNPTRTRNHHSMAHLEIARRNAPTADPGRNLLLPKGSWVASNNAVSLMLRATRNGDFNSLQTLPGNFQQLTESLCKLSLAHQTCHPGPQRAAPGPPAPGPRRQALGGRAVPACPQRIAFFMPKRLNPTDFDGF